jgi:hypothetical protein
VLRQGATWALALSLVLVALAHPGPTLVELVTDPAVFEYRE